MKTKKINLQVCSGTACFVMGGSDLLSIFDFLQPEDQQHVQLSAIPCFEHCRNGNDLRPPFVVIDEVVYDKMSINNLVSILIGKIKEQKES